MSDRRPRQPGNKNLLRGGIRGTSATAARASRAKQAQARRDQKLGELAKDDLGAALEEIAGQMARALVRLHRQVEARKEEPSRAIIDATREFRQTLEAIAAHRASRGQGEAAENLFRDLDERLTTLAETVCPRCHEQMTGLAVVPLVEVPPEPG